MTGLPDSPASPPATARDFHREQLSAMMDGALSADEAKFLLRRMEHDDALADCWERWQFVGDAMRGQAGRALPVDFSRRVGRAIADDLAHIGIDEAVAVPAMAAAQAATRRPLLRWGGGAAVAASVALAALIGSRMLSVPEAPVPAAAELAGTISPQYSTVTPSPIPVPLPEPAPVPDALFADASAAVALAAVSAAGVRPRMLARDEAIVVPDTASSTSDSVPRATPPAAGRTVANAAAARSNGARARLATTTDTAATPSAASSPQPRTADIASAAVAPIERVSKPWPRALVPGASALGEVTAGFDGGRTFHPFPQPRTGDHATLPASPQNAHPAMHAGDSGDAAP